MLTLKKLLFKLAKPFVKLFSHRDHWEENIFYCKRLLFGDSYVITDAGMQSIDKTEVDLVIASLSDFRGISDSPGSPPLIVSLTTYPGRLEDVGYAVFSLLQQTVKPAQLILWLAREEFPDGAPSVFSDFIPFGLRIEFCHNIRSYKKLVPALQKYPESIIVTADDDIYYEPDWLEKLVSAYKKSPQYIHCHKAHYVRHDADGHLLPYRKWKSGISWQDPPSFRNFFIGCGGVLYPPNTLYGDVCQEQLFMEMAPTGDDIWFWAMALMKDTKINVVENNISEMTYIDPAKELGIKSTPLWRMNVGRRLNDKQLNAVLSHYNLFDKICS